MKNLILAALMMTSTLALAQPTKSLNCQFTEPFFDLNIDLENGVVSRVDFDWNDVDPNSDYITTILERNFSVEMNSNDQFAPTFAVIAHDGSVIADIQMDFNGSDGMSDAIFPYSIQYEGMWGGCSSDKIKPITQEEM